VMEFTRALQFFFTSTAYTRIDQIILAGGSAGVPGLADRLQDHAQVPVMLAAPFDGMRIARRVRESQLKQDAPALLTCCGLALRRFAG
jgi:type IV pilus assembly protein PilM